MHILVLRENLSEEGIDDMRLVGVHGPSGRELELLSLQLLPTGPLDHELPRDPAPALLPVQPRIVDQHGDVVDPRVVAHQGEPAIRHRPELVFVLDETVIVELVLVDGALVVRGYRVARAQFLDWDDAVRHALYLDVALEAPLEGREEETVGTLVDLGDLDVLGLFDGLPMLGMLDVQPFRDVADRIRSRLLLRRDEVLLPGSVVQESQGLPGIVGKDGPREGIADDAGALAEDDGGRPEELAFLGQVLDLLAGGEPALVEGELPVGKG